jgi:hypothetical protein
MGRAIYESPSHDKEGLLLGFNTLAECFVFSTCILSRLGLRLPQLRGQSATARVEMLRIITGWLRRGLLQAGATRLSKSFPRLCARAQVASALSKPQAWPQAWPDADTVSWSSHVGRATTLFGSALTCLVTPCPTGTMRAQPRHTALRGREVLSNLRPEGAKSAPSHPRPREVPLCPGPAD